MGCMQPTRLLCTRGSLGKKTGVGCWCPFLGDLPNPGIECAFLVSNLRHELDMRLLSNLKVGGFFTTSATWEDPSHDYWVPYIYQVLWQGNIPFIGTPQYWEVSKKKQEIETEQDHMSPACLLSVENFSQRISLIREMRTCRNKGKQSKETKW